MQLTRHPFEIPITSRVLAVFVIGVFVSIIGCASSPAGRAGKSGAVQAKNSPRLVIEPAAVDYKRKVTVTFSGSGFQPKQELGIEVELGGAPSDVSWLMKPQPVTDEKGAFASKWVLDEEIRRKLFEPKAYKVDVVNRDGVVLASSQLVFKKVEEKPAKK